MSVTLSSARRSIFARLFTNTPGLDPYATAVSDVYQDLFDEGSFTGKGIYEVDAFSKAVDWSFAENHILSHDLIEGCHARSGFVSDVEVFDDFPSRYDADARRQHRWARGDWQLLPWLGPTVPTARGWRRNPISMLGRWKVFDNLRRTLVPASLLLFLVVAWSTNAAISAAAIAFAMCVAGAPALVQVAALLVGWPSGIDWRQQTRESLVGIVNTAAQCGLLFAFLPYRAYLMCDAVARTLWRLFVSKRRLLEWETADAAERRLSATGLACLREMWFAPVWATAVAFVLPARRIASCLAGVAAVVCVAGSCRAIEPPDSAERGIADRRRSADAAADRPQDVGILRTLCDRGRQLPAAGQLSRVSQGEDCPSHVADEFGAVHRIGARGPRFSFHQYDAIG